MDDRTPNTNQTFIFLLAEKHSKTISVVSDILESM